MYKAWQSEDPRQRVTLAQQALEIDPDCVDAYVLLAEDAAQSLFDNLPNDGAALSMLVRALAGL